MRGTGAAVLAVLALGCASAEPPASDGDARPAETSEPLLGDTAAKVLFPVNVLPDVASNFVGYAALPVRVCFEDDPGNLWPLVWLLSPVLGPVCGVMDAWHGYPFWDPVAFDEHREY
jgi:hypothetical protein